MTGMSGHNSGRVSDEDKEVLLAIHTRKLIAARRQKQAAADLEKSHMADVKNDGFNAKEVRDYLDVMLSENQQKHVDQFNMMRRNREKLGVIPVAGKDLFDDRVTREQQIDRDGYETGMNGLDRSPRHTRGGSEDDIWYAGFDRGRAKYDERWEIVLEAMKAARTNEEPAVDPDEADPFGDDEQMEAAE